MNGLMSKSTFNPSGVEFFWALCTPGLHPGLFKFNPFGIFAENARSCIIVVRMGGKRESGSAHIFFCKLVQLDAS